jgi:cytochrome c oxidase cbb3-type subunit 3/ubiquinol-cytochrome c reductase cytochrome c subunit
MKHAALILAATLLLTSCAAPGRESAETRVIRPDDVTDFHQLFSQNCSGCHGADGQGALTVGIARPIYLAIADDATIRNVVEQGRPGTAMPAFGQKAGGMLTDAQIDILIRGLRAHGVKAGTFTGEPAFTATQPGDLARGQSVFTTNCSLCHGPRGPVGLIADSSYLSLVSDQHLRTVVIVGMPNLGMPDWRGHPKPLSDADVTDVVAWLSSQRLPLSAKLSN